MDYYEKLQDRSDNGHEVKTSDEDTAYEMRRQSELDDAYAYYETAVAVERCERKWGKP